LNKITQFLRNYNLAPVIDIKPFIQTIHITLIELGIVIS